MELKSPLLLKEDIMNIEKVIEIKINDITYIVSKVNRNDDYLKEVTAGLLVRAVTSFCYRP